MEKLKYWDDIKKQMYYENILKTNAYWISPRGEILPMGDSQ